MMKALPFQRLTRSSLGILLLNAACLAHAVDAPSPAIPFKREAPAEEFDVRRIVVGFGMAALALGGALYFLRKRLGAMTGETPGVKQLRVLETRRLTPRSTLFVVEFDGVRYLVGESGQSLTCLCTAPSNARSNTEHVQ